MKSAAEEIIEFEEYVKKRERDATEALRRLHNRTHLEPTTEHTPHRRFSLDNPMGFFARTWVIKSESDGRDFTR